MLYFLYRTVRIKQFGHKFYMDLQRVTLISVMYYFTMKFIFQKVLIIQLAVSFKFHCYNNLTTFSIEKKNLTTLENFID